MWTTAFLVALFSTFFISSVGLSAWLLQIGTQLAKIERPTLLRTLVASVLLQVIGAIAASLDWIFAPLLGTLALPLAVLLFGVQLLASWLLIQDMFHTTFRRAILTWLPTMVGTILVLVLAYAVVEPFCVDAFSASSNAMAPTLLGEHWRVPCPVCAKDAVVSPNQRRFARSARPEVGICPHCLHSGELKSTSTEVFGSDRFLINKLIKPRRWDVVVFRPPMAPSEFYVSRLVGLPGEEVAIQDGQIVVDGKPLPPPEPIAALRYVADPLQPDQQSHESYQLGQDEYFMLSDFSRNSEDSRFWEHGIPASDIEGVVTHIYWPRSRWRVLR